MIQSLQIRNYAIIEALEIDFSQGLTIITGETGAGKSILLGALGLIMGERADTKVLYYQEEKCVVEGRFLVTGYDLPDFFHAHDLDFEEELIIRREISPSGKSRAFINDTPVNLKLLQELSSSLVDLHQQFDTLDIHNLSFQLRLVDALAGHHSVLTSYKEDFQQFKHDERRLRQMQDRSQNAAREMEFIQFQLEEFNRAELIDGEQERLEEELTRLTNAEDIKRTTAAAFRHLCEEELSIVTQMQDIGHSLQQIGRVDPNSARLSERFQGILLELQDLGNELEQIAEETEHDPERIQEVQQRLDLIYRLQKKHSVAGVAELLTIQEDLQQQLGAFTDLGEEIERLEKSVSQQERTLRERANVLREGRRTVAPGFIEQVQQQLSHLAMPSAQLAVDFIELDELSPTGLDEIQFLFSANRGARLQSIKDVASGGELSRLTLVTKSLVASAMALPTLIFDEIDSGVSGDIAQKMGDILRRLSEHHQVVVITHSPQVAAKADAHYFIYKVEREDRTITRVRRLEPDERIRAIATMLSQSPPSESALENARELMMR